MIPWLAPTDDSAPFPALDSALNEPNGLLAAGGSLKPERLLNAYRAGIFPWFEDDQPILWWAPNPRLVIKPTELRISRSLKKFINKEIYDCTLDTAFSSVISACSAPRSDEHGTWITSSMIEAYETLFKLGYAHSVEVWFEEELVGGLYGIAIGQVFFGESMFSRRDNASKVGFAFLCEQLQKWGYQLIDCQVRSEHLVSLGAYTISRELFAQHLNQLCNKSVAANTWINQ